MLNNIYRLTRMSGLAHTVAAVANCDIYGNDLSAIGLAGPV